MNGVRSARSRARLLTLCAVLIAGLASPSGAVDFADGRIQIHGYLETQVRALSPNFDEQLDLAQWRNILSIENEIDLLPKGFGPLDSASLFFRLEVSYDCVWTRACGMFSSANAYGDRAKVIPNYYTNAKRNGFVGDDPNVNPVNPQLPYMPNNTNRLVGIAEVPGIEILARNVSFASTFAPFEDYRFAMRQLKRTTSGGDSSGIDSIILPWRPKDKIDNVASLASVTNTTLPLPMRPNLEGTLNGFGTHPGGLYAPSPALRELYAKGVDFGRYDQNFSQNDLAWNHGASQDEKELKEAYLDLTALDGRLFVRLGKQTVVWGKTELFRNTDQFNPTDLALSTLPSLEESRIPLWAMRAIYSFYEVGPLEDVRAELLWLMDDFEPNDVGRCGEPFSPLPVCRKTSQLFLHGALAAGIAGETRPPNWYDSLSGNELGARVEFRWDRFSFAITDFWHWDRFAHPEIIQSYTRNVDVSTGRPLANAVNDAPGGCTTGTETGCLKTGATGPNNALAFNPQNRQLFDVICRSSVGFFPVLDASVCALSIVNSQNNVLTGTPVTNPLTQPSIAALFSNAIAGNPSAAALLGALTGGPVPLVRLNNDPCDGLQANCVTPGPPPNSSFVGPKRLNLVTTSQQQALLGCGPFYGTNCEADGVDLFNAEASVVFQSWPGNNPNAVATRFVNGQTVILPGGHGPANGPNGIDPGWKATIDGCIRPSDPGCSPTALTLFDPRYPGRVFSSELAAASYNALVTVVALDLGQGAGAVGCALPTAANPNAPLNCPTIQDFFSVTATTRPQLKAGGNGRFGRRDFVWAGIGELLLDYSKVNTLGFAMDFAEDVTGTNWGAELTWTANQTFRNTETSNGLSQSDRYAMTISVDRPTIINFLNQGRSFLFNMQWFFEYLPSYVGGGGNRGFETNGPWTQLGTFTIQTGYFQDRLRPSMTFVYDVQSTSGAVIWETAFRFTANAQVTIGVNTFYGKPQSYSNFLALGALGESNQRWAEERFDRLNAVRERDEIYARFRYTF